MDFRVVQGGLEYVAESGTQFLSGFEGERNRIDEESGSALSEIDQHVYPGLFTDWELA